MLYEFGKNTPFEITKITTIIKTKFIITVSVTYTYIHIIKVMQIEFLAKLGIIHSLDCYYRVKSQCGFRSLHRLQEQMITQLNSILIILRRQSCSPCSMFPLHVELTLQLVVYLNFGQHILKSYTKITQKSILLLTSLSASLLPKNGKGDEFHVHVLGGIRRRFVSSVDSQ